MSKKTGLTISEADLIKLQKKKQPEKAQWDSPLPIKMRHGKGRATIFDVAKTHPKNDEWDAPTSKTKKSSKKNINEAPTATVKACIPEIHIGEGYAVLIFRGVKMFTLNDIYAIKEKCPFIDYEYKEAWHKLIHNAVLMAGGAKKFPDFSNGCEITVFRQASRKVDRDALAIMFKYAIDGLRYSKVLVEDNSDIVRDIKPFQKNGEPLSIIRIDTRNEPEEEVDEKTLVESPTSVWINR